MQPQSPFALFSIDHLLSEEERAIRDVVRSFVDDQVRPYVADWFEAGSIPAHWVPRAIDMSAYSTFLDLFVKRRGTPEKPFWDEVRRDLLRH